jgi:hypothetical protein
MSRAVKLVPISVGVAQLGGAGDEIRIEVAVFALIFLDLIDDPFDLFFQLGIFFLLKNVCRAFHPFGNVGVPEDVRLVRLSLLPIATEGGNSARVVESVVNGVDCGGLVQYLFIVQKAVFQNDVLKRKRDHDIFLRKMIDFESDSQFLSHYTINFGKSKDFFIIFNKKYTNGKNGGLGKTKKAVAETATAQIYQLYPQIIR